MTKEEVYRKNAAETVELANHAPSLRDRGRLLSLAERWLDLAHRARGGKRHRAETTVLHPLVEKKLPLRPDAD
jgi:hypothetical protein